MKQALIIGSTVADVTVRLPHLPVTGEDVIVESQSMSLGGCAYNVSEILRQSGVPYTLFSPVGTGIYGNYVREHLKRKQIPILIPTPAADNGCCYCFVEESGERTFAALHGAEYRFERQWFSLAESLSVGSVYVCGLELEEDTGGFILDYLEDHPEYTVYFAPGPRISFIPQSSLRRMFSLSPILHLNREEALEYTGITGSPENKKPWKKADLPCRRQVRSMSAGGCLPSYSPYPQSCHHHPGRPWRVPYGAFGKACLDSRLSGTAGGCHRGRGQPHGCSDCMPHEGFSHGQSHTHSQPYICRCGGTRRSRAGG